MTRAMVAMSLTFDQLGAYANKLEARKRSGAIAPSIADQLIREATNIADRV
jgi:hypothetical protein